MEHDYYCNCAPMVANVAKKVLRKPVLTPLNKMIKTTGLNVKV